MKISKIILFITLNCSFCFSQIKDGKCYITPPIQTSSQIHFKYAYSIASSMYVGQTFTFRATNVSTNRIRAKFDLIALTNCNTEVKESFDIMVEQNESIGFGEAFFDNSYIASVTKNHCAQDVVVDYSFKGKIIKGKNRIKDVYIRNLVVNPIPKKIAKSANSQSKKNSSVDEHNQSIMSELEKNFNEPSIKKTSNDTKKDNSIEDKSNTSNKDKVTIHSYKEGFVNNQFKLIKGSIVYNSSKNETEALLAEDVTFKIQDCFGTIISSKAGTIIRFSGSLDKNSLVTNCVLGKTTNLPIYHYRGDDSKIEEVKEGTVIFFNPGFYHHLGKGLHKSNPNYKDWDPERIIYIK
ncbi:MAG: hypothetical protein KA163_04330 [Bacteroidia bacterium]|nr:hypothetical protein [Bacteroidia bacterium]